MTVTDSSPDHAEGRTTGRSAPGGDQPDHEAVGVGVIRDPRPHADAAEGDGVAEGDGMDTADARTSEQPLDASQDDRLPGLSRDDPAELETITGVVAQTRQDTGTAPADRIVHVLRERLGQVGVDVSGAELDELARQISAGDADENSEPPQRDENAPA
ncbi:hypothetical protein IF188_01590 [Microbacterium sp. NEAU-LLC]|uniref:Uncharacterized protein n=1 Tax=Microbacterium helvum TaxID=2773713 RepID=A0ABR8NMX3_9MICO|nr:hypothetical protein [Microbacterium helvum]MBD3940391.1 hypothetical protein [Microbacterium helvum]